MRALVLAFVVSLPLFASPASAQEERPWKDLPRLRFGADGGAGMSWDALGTPGGAIHGGVRLGLQVDEFFGVYYQGRVSGQSLEIARGRTVWHATTSNGVGFDVTLLDVVQLGGGLAVDWLAGDACGRQLCVGADEGTYLGIDLRLAFVVFSMENTITGQRRGVLVGGRWHTTALPDQRSGVGALHTLTIDAGWELF